MLREMTCDPKFRRVLITDGRSAVGQALAKAFSDAGAAIVFVGRRGRLEAVSRPGRVRSNRARRNRAARRDRYRVGHGAGRAESARSIDILVNTAEHVRAGGVVGSSWSSTIAREEMDIRYLGLMRLAQAFGPVLRSRGADGANSAAAWVNILSVHALMQLAGLRQPFGDSKPHACPLSQCMRAELRPGGVRVLNVFSARSRLNGSRPCRRRR